MTLLTELAEEEESRPGTTQQRSCVRRQDARTARTLNAGDDGREALRLCVVALCAPEHFPTDDSKKGADAVVSGACGGDDCGSGAGVLMPVERVSAKCAAPRRAWRPEVLEGGCSPAAASPGNSKVGRSLTH